MTFLTGSIEAPTEKAVIVLESGLVVTLDVRLSERYSQKRSVSKSTIETGYKISDGNVTDMPEIAFEGIITGVSSLINLPRKPFDKEQADAAIASIDAAFKAEELATVYTSFITVPDCVFTLFDVEATPKQTAYIVKIEAESIRRVTFATAQGAPTKTSKPAGKAKISSGKKTAESISTNNAPKTDILHF
ncbi:phage baseplate protein [Yersinia pekkanenii]|uniref:Dit-like phage tail protein N-terminal domain-containing protein n=1 Tax=Yersinia pekkanenii TaxID=1288385 RepID=A0A0T9RHC6_9GAMM|nr:hypothetical protein [Yersinia pekkanenii]CNI62876.1 Uncharacterised protein [Yersinia pekkanenii]CRY67559.1 Uncharacterised protein [Yersinia pekkanenii]